MKIITKQQEAINFIYLYKNETQQSEAWLEDRIQQIRNGTFELTTEEIEFGARVAWRNSNKCIGRLFWQSLTIFDQRNLLEPKQIAEALFEHINFATNNGKIRPAISIFAEKRVRIWNHQLIRYAGYETSDGIIGDPHSVDFTKQVQRLGWRGEGTNFDILPLCIQVDNEEPQLFEIPKQMVLEIPLEHPEHPNFDKLNLKWYAVPIISDMQFDCAGVKFQAAPFNGWYMGTEIGARNFADVKRYNMLPKVADTLSIARDGNISLWKDRTLVELNIAVLHSFKKYGASIVDHHTAAQQFKMFQQKEQEMKRKATGNWTWLIPPMSPATTHIFHEPIANVIEKPNYFYQSRPY